MTALTFAQACASPCASCDTTPCCRRAPLDTFVLRDVLDLDHARFLLNFEGIELGVTSDGSWQVFFLEACRMLDVEHGRCTVHGTVDQPQVCRTYSAHRCWYRPAIAFESDPEHLRVDRRRFDHVLDRVVLDEQRGITRVPSWDELVTAFAALPIVERAEPRPANPPGQDPDAPDGHPCNGCAAWCCTTLPFPIDVPEDVAGLDHLRFLLGFPSVSLVVADTGWTLAVETRCRHLAGTGCSVMGDPRRPLRCGDHDAWSCRYPEVLGGEPGPHVRIRLDDFPRLVAGLAIGADGRVGPYPDAVGLRAAIERPSSEVEAVVDPRVAGGAGAFGGDGDRSGVPSHGGRDAHAGSLVGMALPVIGSDQARRGGPAARPPDRSEE